MVGLAAWCRYFVRRFEFSVDMVHWGRINNRIWTHEILGFFGEYLFRSRMTFLYFNKEGDITGMLGGTLLIRKIPLSNERTIRVNDVVILTDPECYSSMTVRRVVAVPGHEMASTDPSEKSFFLQEKECWITSDNREPKDTSDSRSYGPACLPCTYGRVIYCFRSSNDHTPVDNCSASIEEDAPVLEVELDIDEMEKYHKEQERNPSK